MCRQILQRMRAAAGDSLHQRWDQTTVGDLIDTTLEGIRDPHRVDVTDGSEAVEGQPLWVPQEAVAQGICSKLEKQGKNVPASGCVNPTDVRKNSLTHAPNGPQ